MFDKSSLIRVITKFNWKDWWQFCITNHHCFYCVYEILLDFVSWWLPNNPRPAKTHIFSLIIQLCLHSFLPAWHITSYLTWNKMFNSMNVCCFPEWFICLYQECRMLYTLSKLQVIYLEDRLAECLKKKNKEKKVRKKMKKKKGRKALCIMEKKRLIW